MLWKTLAMIFFRGKHENFTKKFQLMSQNDGAVVEMQSKNSCHENVISFTCLTSRISMGLDYV